jgi:hypothetical protein
LTDGRVDRRHLGGIESIPARRRPNDTQFVAVQLMPHSRMAQAAQRLFAVRAANSDRKPLGHVVLRGCAVNRSGNRRLMRYGRLRPATASAGAAAEAAVGKHPDDGGPKVSTADAVDEEVDRRVERHQHVTDVAYL